MLSCEEVTRLVSESLDRQLPLSRRISLRVHFLMCTFCRRYRQHLLFMRDAIRHYSRRMEEMEYLPTISLSSEARRRIKHSLSNSAK